uniref:Uncharacterized protein n=1 Tax=Desertifilum tharense IPPAS B-1220 TaxID=1781255 RepID=A0ACD5H0D3_9CYAN
MGLAEPREACTLAQVQGWRLVVSDGRTNWVYRTDLEGRVVRPETGNTSGSLPNAVTTAVFNDVANRTRINTSQLMVVDSRQQTWYEWLFGFGSTRTLLFSRCGSRLGGNGGSAQ